MVFGALILIFSLFYYGRYAKKNFNDLFEENKKKNNNVISINENESSLKVSTIALEVSSTDNSRIIWFI